MACFFISKMFETLGMALFEYYLEDNLIYLYKNNKNEYCLDKSETRILEKFMAIIWTIRFLVLK